MISQTNNFGQSPTTGATTMESITSAISPKSLSPIEERMEQLAKAQGICMQSLDHLFDRLAPVLCDPIPGPDGANETKLSPPSPLAADLEYRISAQRALSSRITDILERLTL